VNCTLVRASPYGITDVCLKAFLFGGCILLITNCNLFKNTATDLRKSHELSTAITQVRSEEQKDWLSRSGSVSFHQDSSNQDYAIRIWPRGVFTFSPEKGFTGEADRVLVTGKAKTGSSSSETTTALQQDKGKIQQELNLKKKDVSEQKLKLKKSVPSWKLVIAGVAFMGVLCCFIYTKIKLILKI
jgi:hypothetical protein